MPTEAKEKAQTELSKLKNMAPMSPRRRWFEVSTDVKYPFSNEAGCTRIWLAQEVLDADHYGLTEVKERIIEYLAVQNRVSK